MAEAIPILIGTLLFRLEEEFHGKLQDASSLLVGHFPKVGIGLSKLLRHRILLEVEIQVTAVERP